MNNQFCLAPFLLFITVMLILSCNNSNQNQSLFNEPVYSVKINPDTLPERKMLNLSEFVSVPSVLRLETKPDALMSYIYKIYCYKQFLFIGDGEGYVFVYDTTGRFQYKLGMRGDGPQEFIRINSWAFNPKKEQFLLLDDRKRKIKVFDIAGKFIEEKDLSIYTTDLALLNNEKVVFYNNYNSSNEKYPYSLIYFNNDKVDKLTFPIDYIGDDTYISVPQPFSLFKDDVFFHSACSYTIYKLNGDSATAYFNADFGDAGLPPNCMTNDFGDEKRRQLSFTGKNRVNLKYIKNIDRFYDADEVIYFQFTTAKSGYDAFYLKKEKKIAVGTGTNCDLEGLEGLPVDNLFFSQTGEIFIEVSPGTVFKFLQVYKDANITPPKDLVEFSKTINIADNPVLLRCRFKANFK